MKKRFNELLNKIVSIKVLIGVPVLLITLFFEKIDGVSRFAVDFCCLTSLQGHAIPLTKKMIEYLRSNQLVHPDADEQQIEGFLARQIPAANAYEFYALLRRQSESRKEKRKIKTIPKTKTKAKTRTKKKTKETISAKA